MFLARLGKGCAGALSIISEGEAPGKQGWSYEALTEADQEKHLRQEIISTLR